MSGVEGGSSIRGPKCGFFKQQRHEVPRAPNILDELSVGWILQASRDR